MKWEVRKPDGSREIVEAESAYANPVGVLVFMRKSAAPIQADAPPKKKPGKPVTVAVRGFASGKWDDYILIEA